MFGREGDDGIECWKEACWRRVATFACDASLSQCLGECLVQSGHPGSVASVVWMKAIFREEGMVGAEEWAGGAGDGCKDQIVLGGLVFEHSIRLFRAASGTASQ